MKKKLSFSVLIAGILAIVTVVTVFAGATFDLGTLAPLVSGGDPPAEGEANWTAWWLVYPSTTDQAGTPYEILTEDNTNADDGQDIGYSTFFDPNTVNWVLQIENFLIDPDTSSIFEDGDPIYMMFGGLGSYSGSLWEYTINEWIITESSTDHGEVSSPITGSACPSFYEEPINISGDTYTYQFFGAPGTYHVYRSQNGSGAGNGASNGQYFWIDTVATDSFGYGTFVDTTTEQSWYVVIQADPITNEIIGCHSEPADPTGVTIFSFEATYILHENEVELEWQTTNEVDILGYNVWRSTSEAGVKTQVNTEGLIEPNPGGLGGLYAFTDDTVERGMTYYYWIEYVETGGSWDMEGPEEVQTWFVYYLPLFSQ